MPPKAGAGPTPEQLKKKFSSYDKNGDGCLDIGELKELLKAGNPNMSNKQIENLYKAVDSNGDGVVQFDEFVDYIYSQTAPDPKSGAGRNAKHAAANANADQGNPDLWPDVKNVFESFVGKDCDGREFAKMMKDSGVLDKKFTVTDVDLVFSGSVVKGQKRLMFDEFQNACKKIATKKGCSVEQLQQQFCESGGPTFSGTKGDATRLHDDKSTYTGQHGDKGPQESRNERAAKAAEVTDEGDASLWSQVDQVFKAFVGEDCDGKEFAKLCSDCCLLDRSFKSTDCDIIFAGSVVKGQRRMKEVGFRKACGKVAAKKNISVAEVQQAIIDAGGPKFKGTEGASKFHDDKSQYTGMHKGADSKEEESRNSRLQRDNAVQDAGDESLWPGCKEVFEAFVGESCDGREFAKMCKECKMEDRNFKSTDYDIIFAGSVTKGQRAMNFQQFKVACGKIAVKKKCSVADLQATIIHAGGPTFTATKSENLGRFANAK